MNFIPAPRQRRKFVILGGRTPHQLQYFRKKSSFRNFGAMKPLAWVTITFLFRNGGTWEQDGTKPWPIGVDRSWRFSKLVVFNKAERPRRPKTSNLYKGIRFGNRPWLGITLRCNHSTNHLDWFRATARQWNSRQRRKFVILGGRTPHQLQLKAGGKPSTWLPPGGLAEWLQTKMPKQIIAKRKPQKEHEPKTSKLTTTKHYHARTNCEQLKPRKPNRNPGQLNMDNTTNATKSKTCLKQRNQSQSGNKPQQRQRWINQKKLKKHNDEKQYGNGISIPSHFRTWLFCENANRQFKRNAKAKATPTPTTQPNKPKQSRSLKILTHDCVAIPRTHGASQRTRNNSNDHLDTKAAKLRSPSNRGVATYNFFVW